MVNETMWQKIKNIENKEQILFWLGLIVMVAATTIETLRGRENVEFVLNAAITELKGEDELTGIVVRQNGEDREIPVTGLFVAIGHEPDLGAFGELTERDEQGYAAAGEDCLTKTEGVFVAGDCRRKKVRQVTTAAADGAAAALAACAWLDR